MKVHELIELLETMPPNDEVRIASETGLLGNLVEAVYHVSTYGQHCVEIS